MATFYIEILSYLTNCTQSVSFNNIKSDHVNLKVWCPRFSVLGPILYTLLLGALIRRYGIDFYMYAEDTQMYVSMEFSQLPVENRRL